MKKVNCLIGILHKTYIDPVLFTTKARKTECTLTNQACRKKLPPYRSTEYPQRIPNLFQLNFPLIAIGQVHFSFKGSR